MMDAFCAVLEARDPAHGRMRAYQVKAGTDLFGVWLVEVTYGPIGTHGRSIRYVASDDAAARRRVNKVLHRRATAWKRIGVSYRFCRLLDPGHWFQLPWSMQGRRPEVIDKSVEEAVSFSSEDDRSGRFDSWAWAWPHSYDN
jgi:hypothetical protein